MTETNDAAVEGGGVKGRPSLFEASQTSFAGPSDRGSMNMKILTFRHRASYI